MRKEFSAEIVNSWKADYFAEIFQHMRQRGFKISIEAYGFAYNLDLIRQVDQVVTFMDDVDKFNSGFYLNLGIKLLYRFHKWKIIHYQYLMPISTAHGPISLKIKLVNQKLSSYLKIDDSLLKFMVFSKT